MQGNIERNYEIPNIINFDDYMKDEQDKKKVQTVKTKVDPVNLLKDNEIYELYISDRNIAKNLTNERLIKMIQNGYEEMWNILYVKTEKSIHNVYHKKVHEYYKSTMEEDIYSVLRYGWTNAVLTYNEEKATAPFVAYASYLMYQQYVMLVRKIKPNRIGKSVRHEHLESATLEMGNSNFDKQKEFLVQNLLVDKTNQHSAQENIILLKQALEALKEEKKDLYDLVMLHYIKGIPQTQIATMNNHGQSYISRKIKKGVKFLYDFMLIKSKGSIDNLKVEMLSSFE